MHHKDCPKHPDIVRIGDEAERYSCLCGEEEPWGLLGWMKIPEIRKAVEERYEQKL